MPVKDSRLNLRWMTITNVEQKDDLVLEASYHGLVGCPACQSRQLRKKAAFVPKQMPAPTFWEEPESRIFSKSWLVAII